MIVLKKICDNCKEEIKMEDPCDGLIHSNTYHRITYEEVGINSEALVKNIERDMCDECFRRSLFFQYF